MGEVKASLTVNHPALQKCGTTKSPPEVSTVKHLPDANSNAQDQISKLPDDILFAILHFLTLKEAAVTSVVSRRWVHLWKSKTMLNFDGAEALDSAVGDNSLLRTERGKYINWVNQVLRVHEGPLIEEFRVSFDLRRVHKIDIDHWLEFAFAKKVQRLELDLTDCYGCTPEERYTFPFELFLAQGIGPSLAEPYPDCRGIFSSPFLDSKPLKTLSLKYVNVTGESLQLFLLNCPLLEHVLVHDSLELVNLEVSGRSLMLRSLEISYCPNVKSIKICNVNLASFKLYGSLDTVVILQDLPLLVEATIGSFAFINDAFSTLSSCLSTLQTLTLCFDTRDYEKEILEFPELPRVKQLTLEITVYYGFSFLGFASVVNAFPCLEKCTYELMWMRDFRPRCKIAEIPDCPHQCLKIVEFQGYYATIYELELAMYFIKNAVGLEELIIDPRMVVDCIDCDSGMSEETIARSFAQEQFESIIVPPHTKLKIL